MTRQSVGVTTGQDDDFVAAMRRKMRDVIDSGAPVIVLQCMDGQYHMLSDGVSHERTSLLLGAAKSRVDRFLAEEATKGEVTP